MHWFGLVGAFHICDEAQLYETPDLPLKLVYDLDGTPVAPAIADGQKISSVAMLF